MTITTVGRTIREGAPRRNSPPSSLPANARLALWSSPAAESPVKQSMRDRFMRSLMVVSVCAFGWAAGASAQDVNVIAAAVDARYNHLRTLEAEFPEVYQGSGMERTESGTLWLKKPGKMRWEYRSPREKLFVSDGKDAWFYVPDDRQARKESAKKLEDIRSPLAFLLGKTKLQKELKGLSLATDQQPVHAGDMVLRG